MVFLRVFVFGNHSPVYILKLFLLPSYIFFEKSLC